MIGVLTKTFSFATISAWIPVLIKALLRAMDTLHDLVMVWGRNANVDDEVLENTLRAVLFFALTGKDRQILVESAIIGQPLPRIWLSREDVSLGVILVRLLGHGVHPSVRRQTVKLLADLAASPDNQMKIASCFGVVDELVGLLEKVGDVVLHEQTARCLANLAEAEGNHLTMASFKILNPLLRVLARDGRPKVQQEIARWLTNIAMSSPDNAARIAESPEALNALMTLLIKDEPQTFYIGVIEQTIRCLNTLSSLQESLQLKVLNEYPGTLAALVRLLAARRAWNTQRLALKLLRGLSQRYQRNKVIISSHPGLLSALLRLLSYSWMTRGRIKVQLEAARCLVNLLSDTEPVPESTLLQIGSNKGAFSVLVKCMDTRYRVRIVQSLAVECFKSLARAPENRWKIVSHRGVLPALLKQMASAANPSGEEHAAWCLAKLADTQEIKIFLASKAGVLDALVTVIRRAKIWVTLEPAITCLASLAEIPSKEIKVTIASHTGVIDSVVSLLTLSGMIHADSMATELATKCLCHLAMASDNIEEICSKPGLLSAFVSLLQEDGSSDEVLEYTTTCLADLACSSDNKGTIGAFPGMLDVLVPFLVPKGGLERVQEQVVSCLSQLSVAPANQVQLRSYSSALTALRALAKGDGATSTKDEAASCLTNLMSPHRVFGYIDSQLNLSSVSWHDDPLTWDMMCDPVKCNDGFTYDRWTIIDNGMRRSPYARGMAKFAIACDDVDVRRRLFQRFPQQQAKFRSRRQQYRKRALENSNTLQLEVAVEMLSNVLQWDPSDTICQNELNRMLSPLQDQPSQAAQPPRGVPTQTLDPVPSRRIFIDPGVEPDVDQGMAFAIYIPVVDHIYVSQTRDLWKHGRAICLLAASVYFGLLLAATSLR